MNRQLLRLARQALRTRSKRSFAMLALVALIALGTWWFSDRGGEGSTTVVTEPSATLVADAGAEPAADTTEVTVTTERTVLPSTDVSHPSVVVPTDPQPTEPAEQPPAATEAPTGIDANSGLPFVPVSALPPEAAETLALIDSGGPYPYDRDGLTFGNFEGILPDETRGYYREFTVETPGLSHRGARRIVAGDGGELYWTDDHYESFSVIVR